MRLVTRFESAEDEQVLISEMRFALNRRRSNANTGTHQIVPAMTEWTHLALTARVDWMSPDDVGSKCSIQNVLVSMGMLNVLSAPGVNLHK